MVPKKVFKDDKAPLYALLAAVLQVFGTDVIDVEPELIKEEIEKQYDLKISQLQSDKIQAAIILLATHQFEEDWRVFESVCNLCCNQAIDSESVNPAEAEEIVVAMAELALIRSNVQDEEDETESQPLHFSEEVRAYAGRMFYEYGFSQPPKLFASAIMPPHTVDTDDEEKNNALLELFNAHANYVFEYLE